MYIHMVVCKRRLSDKYVCAAGGDVGKGMEEWLWMVQGRGCRGCRGCRGFDLGVDEN